MAVIRWTSGLAPDGILGFSKAIGGAVVGAGAAVATALEDGVIEGAEWWAIALGALVGAGLIGAVPNKIKPTVVGVPPVDPPLDQ